MGARHVFTVLSFLCASLIVVSKGEGKYGVPNGLENNMWNTAAMSSNLEVQLSDGYFPTRDVRQIDGHWKLIVDGEGIPYECKGSTVYNSLGPLIQLHDHENNGTEAFCQVPFHAVSDGELSSWCTGVPIIVFEDRDDASKVEKPESKRWLAGEAEKMRDASSDEKSIQYVWWEMDAVGLRAFTTKTAGEEGQEYCFGQTIDLSEGHYDLDGVRAALEESRPGMSVYVTGGLLDQVYFNGEALLDDCDYTPDCSEGGEGIISRDGVSSFCFGEGSDGAFLAFGQCSWQARNTLEVCVTYYGRCGNGALDLGCPYWERCDDENAESGDGCSSQCEFEHDTYELPVVPEPSSGVPAIAPVTITAPVVERPGLLCPLGHRCQYMLGPFMPSKGTVECSSDVSLWTAGKRDVEATEGEVDERLAPRCMTLLDGCPFDWVPERSSSYDFPEGTVGGLQFHVPTHIGQTAPTSMTCVMNAEGYLVQLLVSGTLTLSGGVRSTVNYRFPPRVFNTTGFNRKTIAIPPALRIVKVVEHAVNGQIYQLVWTMSSGAVQTCGNSVRPAEGACGLGDCSYRNATYSAFETRERGLGLPFGAYLMEGGLNECAESTGLNLEEGFHFPTFSVSEACSSTGKILSLGFLEFSKLNGYELDGPSFHGVYFPITVPCLAGWTGVNCDEREVGVPAVRNSQCSGADAPCSGDIVDGTQWLATTENAEVDSTETNVFWKQLSGEEVASVPVVTDVEAPGVWYEVRHTLGGTRRVTLDFCYSGSALDTEVNVWKGCECELQKLVTGNSRTLPGCGGLGVDGGAKTEWCAESSTSYYVYVSGRLGTRDSFVFSMEVDESGETCSPADNDYWRSATEVILPERQYGSKVFFRTPVSGTNRLARLQDLSYPMCIFDWTRFPSTENVHSAWYKFTGDGSMAHIELRGLGNVADTTASLYLNYCEEEDCSADCLVCLTGLDNYGGGSQPRLDWQTEVGEVYWLRIGAARGDTGDFQFELWSDESAEVLLSEDFGRGFEDVAPPGWVNWDDEWESLDERRARVLQLNGLEKRSVTSQKPFWEPIALPGRSSLSTGEYLSADAGEESVSESELKGWPKRHEENKWYFGLPENAQLFGVDGSTVSFPMAYFSGAIFNDLSVNTALRSALVEYPQRDGKPGGVRGAWVSFDYILARGESDMEVYVELVKPSGGAPGKDATTHLGSLRESPLPHRATLEITTFLNSMDSPLAIQWRVKRNAGWGGLFVLDNVEVTWYGPIGYRLRDQ